MLEEHLTTANYNIALEALAQGEKLPKDINRYNKIQLFDKLVLAKQFAIIKHFLKDKTIGNDIYEYDSFDNSIFTSIASYLADDDDSLAFLNDFLSGFDNLNDEVDGKTLLAYFLQKGAKPALIKTLVEAGCATTFVNNAQENYLHQVIKANLMKPELIEKYIAFFIGEGVDVNAADIVQKTPLIVAVQNHKEEYLDLLLENGANPNEPDKDGNTAFFYAVARQVDASMYEKLRKYDSPQFDLLNKDQVSLLLEYVRIISDSDSDSQLLKKLLEDGADPYQSCTKQGKNITPIDLIAQKSADILQVLLKSGSVDVNRQDDSGNTLLHKVCAYNINYEENKAKETYRKVKLLIENGADSAIANNKDETALMLASNDNLKAKTVEFLLKQSL